MFSSPICIFITVIVQQCPEERASFSTSYRELFGPQRPLHLLFPLMEALPLMCVWPLLGFFPYLSAFSGYVIFSERLSLGTLYKSVVHYLLKPLSSKSPYNPYQHLKVFYLFISSLSTIGKSNKKRTESVFFTLESPAPSPMSDI